MPCMRSTRPMICPKRPKPQMITGVGSASIVSYAGAGAGFNRAHPASAPANRIGVATIEAAVTSVANAASPALSAPAATAAPNSTKLNSLACGKARPKRSALRVRSPAMRASTKAIAALTRSNTAVASTSSAGCARASGRSADMPTEMKKKPSSRPSNGSISACSSWRYSDSDSSTPAMKAPSDGDRPATVASEAAPATMSSATVVNTSGVFAPPTARNSGGSRKRPPIRMTAMTAAARATSSQGRRSGRASPASSGTSATSGMNARSWNSSTANASRPARLVSRSRSASIGSTIAVDDIARPAPSTTAPCPGDADRMRECRQRRAGDHHLRRAQPEHRAPHHPQALRPDLQADQEQQHHHAQAGDRGNRIDVGDQPQPAGADDDAGEQIAEHAAEAGAARQRHGDRCGGEQDDECGQHAMPPPPVRARNAMPRARTGCAARRDR